jgi:redox-sensitive bicupin YhaK (pirin superfamily)
MILLRPSKERGYEDKGWLQTYHTFSFDTYYDPDHLSFHTLRVLNEDVVAGQNGFPMHKHRDMEIVTYVLEGSLEHKDSMGNVATISKGEVQRLSAGLGVTHSERNVAHHQPVHFLQIWITPTLLGLNPSYAQTAFQSAAKWGQFCLMVSSNGRNGSLSIHQDADIYSTILDQNDETTFEALPERHIWIQIVSGSFLVQNSPLQKGDGAALTNELLISIKCLEGGELLLFDLG